jgi:hypothetical protein
MIPYEFDTIPLTGASQGENAFEGPWGEIGSELEFGEFEHELPSSDFEDESFFELENIRLLSSTRDEAVLKGRIAEGMVDANKLTDAVFYNRHPEWKGKSLSGGSQALRKEWVQIRDAIVRPFLKRQPAAKPAAKPAPSIKPVPGGEATNEQFNDVMRRLKIAVEAMNHPRKSFLLCIIDKIMRGGDDRVILWTHIAPRNPMGFVSLKLRVRTNRMPAVDVQWLWNNIKTKADVERQPSGAGFSGRLYFVTSMKEYIMRIFRYFPETLQDTVNQIFETHNSLQAWIRLDTEQGGGHAMPRDYRSILDWLSEKERDPTTVLSCVPSIGWVK